MKEMWNEEMQKQEMLGPRTHHNPLFNNSPNISPTKEMRIAQELSLYLPPTNSVDNNQKENQADAQKPVQSYEIKAAVSRTSPIRGVLQERQSMQSGKRSSPEQSVVKSMPKEDCLPRAIEVVDNSVQSSPILLSIAELQRRIKDILEEEEEMGDVETEIGDGEEGKFPPYHPLHAPFSPRPHFLRLRRTLLRSDAGKPELNDELKKESTLPYHPKLNLLSPRPQFLRYRPNRRLEFLCGDNAEEGPEERSHGRLELFREDDIDGCSWHLEPCERLDEANRLEKDWDSSSEVIVDEPTTITMENKAAEIEKDEESADHRVHYAKPNSPCITTERGLGSEGEIDSLPSSRAENPNNVVYMEKGTIQGESTHDVREEQASNDKVAGEERQLQEEKSVQNKENKYYVNSSATRCIVSAVCFILLVYSIKTLLSQSSSFGIRPAPLKQEDNLPLGSSSIIVLRSHRMSEPLLRRQLSSVLKGWVTGELGFPAQITTSTNNSELLKSILAIHGDSVRRKKASLQPASVCSGDLPSAAEVGMAHRTSEAFVSVHEKNANAQIIIPDIDGLSLKEATENKDLGHAGKVQESEKEDDLFVLATDQSVSNEVGVSEELDSGTADEVGHVPEKVQFRDTNTEDQQFALKWNKEMLPKCRTDCRADSNHVPEDISHQFQRREKNVEMFQVWNEERENEVDILSALPHKDQNSLPVVSGTVQQDSGSDNSLTFASQKNLQHIRTQNSPPFLLNTATSLDDMQLTKKPLESEEHRGYFKLKPSAIIFCSIFLAISLVFSSALRSPSALDKHRLASSNTTSSRAAELQTSPVEQVVARERATPKRVNSTLKQQVSCQEQHLTSSPRKDPVSPFGSFTDYKGSEKEQIRLTPVRRSSRIRNRVLSPAEQRRLIKSPR
ncbi:hypothetical protein O6H91_03G081300 [Diphasiastrum complanatum]|uniref:Uncharacterized protein n=1 Tax=Diphasiastrum complanatum TaxID=34168 RepID=A0ACC2E881_DIPCM|nr:hypothetical protein O6H91_03G081300 [Diphasiastrum complanatum]